jgi:hypothetical protein
MKKNLGNVDRAIRVLLGILFAVLYFTNVITGITGIILLILGGVFILTAIFSFCPIYWPLGLSTKKEVQ